MASVFRRKGSGPWLIQFFDQHGRRREKSSRTTDRRAAERIASKLEADVALRREGVVDPRQDRFAEENRKPLAQHIREYLQHCRGRGVSAKLIRDRQMHLEWILAETRASRLSDLTLEPVERVLMAYWKLGRSPRTVNTRRESLRAFANWCRKTGRTESNQLELLPKLDENSDRRYIRRPLGLARPRGRTTHDPRRQGEARGRRPASPRAARGTEGRAAGWGDGHRSCVPDGGHEPDAQARLRARRHRAGRRPGSRRRSAWPSSDARHAARARGHRAAGRATHHASRGLPHDVEALHDALARRHDGGDAAPSRGRRGLSSAGTGFRP